MRHHPKIYRFWSLLPLILAFAPVRPASAQSTIERESTALRLITGGSWTALWDDETALGRGLVASGGIARPFGGHVSLEVELAAGAHHRDAGYLAAEGSPVTAVGRVAYSFGAPASHARAFVSAGAGAIHSSGHFTIRSIVPDPRGLPVEGPSVRRDWSLTRPAFEVGAGVGVTAGSRLEVRPEFRWLSTAGNGASARSALEPPLWMLRAGVTLVWRTERR